MKEEEERNYIIKTESIPNSKQNQSPTKEELTNIYNESELNEIKVNEEKLKKLLGEDVDNAVTVHSPDETTEQVIRRLRLEGMLLYYSINNELAKSERLLRDSRNVRTVLMQKYDRAKESLALHDKILSSQTNDARNYFGILCAIYDAVAKYTLPSARLMSDLANLQAEIETEESKETQKDIENWMGKIGDSLQALNLPGNITKNPKDISKMFEDMAAFIEKNREKYLKLEKESREIYETSTKQRDVIQKDITVILSNISENNERLIKLENDFNKVSTNMNQLLTYMQEKLEVQLNEGVPLLN